MSLNFITFKWLSLSLLNQFPSKSKYINRYFLCNFLQLFCTAKKVIIQLYTDFFLFTSCVPDFHGLYTRNFNFRHCCTFTFCVYTRTVIYQPHTRIFDIYSLIPNQENHLLCFWPWSDISLLIPQKIWSLLLNQCVWSMQIFLVK